MNTPVNENSSSEMHYTLSLLHWHMGMHTEAHGHTCTGSGMLQEHTYGWNAYTFLLSGVFSSAVRSHGHQQEEVKWGPLVMPPLALWGTTKRGSMASMEGNSQASHGPLQPALWTPEGCLIINTQPTKQPRKAFLPAFLYSHHRDRQHFSAPEDLERPG